MLASLLDKPVIVEGDISILVDFRPTGLGTRLVLKKTGHLGAAEEPSKGDIEIWEKKISNERLRSRDPGFKDASSLPEEALRNLGLKLLGSKRFD